VDDGFSAELKDKSNGLIKNVPISPIGIKANFNDQSMDEPNINVDIIKQPNLNQNAIDANNNKFATLDILEMFGTTAKLDMGVKIELVKNTDNIEPNNNNEKTPKNEHRFHHEIVMLNSSQFSNPNYNESFLQNLPNFSVSLLKRI